MIQIEKVIVSISAISSTNHLVFHFSNDDGCNQHRCIFCVFRCVSFTTAYSGRGSKLFHRLSEYTIGTGDDKKEICQYIFVRDVLYGGFFLSQAFIINLDASCEKLQNRFIDLYQYILRLSMKTKLNIQRRYDKLQRESQRK